ncbi:MAG: type III pantothenate kinase [Calditrichia bacterium]|nr:type III pantothenate kinase [Calditrichia bacterium]
MMILTIDIGNTQIEVGIFKTDQLVRSWRISSVIDRTEDEYMVFLEQFLKQIDMGVEHVEGVGLASVVPNKTFIIEKMCKKYLNIQPLIVDHTIKLGIQIKYDDPASVGADRLCNCVAAFHQYKQAIVVVDFGTATTFDIVNGKGNYLGGIISPGIETTAWALYQRAAKLPKISLDFPTKVIGTTPEKSMQSGIMLGTVKIVDGLLQEVIEELGEQPKIIATGGLGRLVQPKTRHIGEYRPHLVLEGLYQIFLIN